jgi:hypothetical protein
MSAPLGAVYVTVCPSEAPRMALPSADSGLYTVRSVVAAISREPSRNVSVSLWSSSK